MPTAVCATEVNLVAVIARRIMRSGDHNSRRKVSLLHGKGKHRGRHALVEKKSLDAGGSHYLCAVAGKDIAVDAPVVADNSRRPIEVLEQIGRKSSRCLSNQHTVHAVRASSQLASKARGAKAQALAAAIQQCYFVSSSDQVKQFAAGLGIGVLFGPSRCRLKKFVEIHW